MLHVAQTLSHNPTPPLKTRARFTVWQGGLFWHGWGWVGVVYSYVIIYTLADDDGWL